MASRRPAFDGDYVRANNLFPRLAQQHDAALVYVDTHHERSYAAPYSRHFSRVYHIDCAPSYSIVSRARDKLRLRHAHQLRDGGDQTSRLVAERIAGILAEERADIVLAWSRSLVDALRRFTVPVVFDLCDAVSLQLAQEAADSRWSLHQAFYRLRYHRFEADIARHFPSTFVSKKDAAWFKDAKDVAVIPNGVSAVPCPSESPGGNIIAFSGNMSFKPNVDAALYFFSEILPAVYQEVPDLVWYIVGADPAPEIIALQRHPAIRVTGTVPDVAEYLCRAQVVIAPMRQGSGIKNKVLEAMALRRCVVTTSAGAEGIRCQHQQHVMIADQASDFARIVVAMLRNADARHSIAESARLLVEGAYSWDATAAEYSRLFRRLTLSGADQPAADGS